MDEQNIRFTAEQIENRTAALIANRKHRAGEGIRKVAQAIFSMGEKFGEQDQRRLSEISAKAAAKVDAFGRAVQEKEIEELIGDAKRMGKEHPVILWGGALVLGFFLARFFFRPGEKRGTGSPGEADVFADEEFWEKGI